jgi:hypothetical protein
MSFQRALSVAVVLNISCSTFHAPFHDEAKWQSGARRFPRRIALLASVEGRRHSQPPHPTCITPGVTKKMIALARRIS